MPEESSSSAFRPRTSAQADGPAESRKALSLVREELREVLRINGVVAALGYLNARVRFRYTGIFHPEPPLLRNFHLFDRENPTLNVSGNVIALVDGYCGLTCSSNSPFATPDSLRDARLDAHPARESMRSYVGVPLRMTDDTAWGTLCHFDMRPRVIPPSEVSVLEQAALLFVDWLRAHESS